MAPLVHSFRLDRHERHHYLPGVSPDQLFGSCKFDGWRASTRCSRPLRRPGSRFGRHRHDIRPVSISLSTKDLSTVVSRLTGQRHCASRPSLCACASGPDDIRRDRRQFLKAVGIGAGALALRPWQAMAGPFPRADFDTLVPADKKLRPEWVQSLTDRGQRAAYRGADLEKIGMPVGGICTGQLYLGGDGRLWHWDIFNQRTSTGPDHYAKPLTPTSPLTQGFALRIQTQDGTQIRPLDRTHWRDLTFIGEYPIGYVQYRDSESPVSVRLEAYSPFIPLNTEDSSLPATVLEFTVTNQSN